MSAEGKNRTPIKSDRGIGALKATGRDDVRVVAGAQGLYIRISKSGVRSFVYRYKRRDEAGQSKTVWLTLGCYDAGYPLSAARKEALRLTVLRGDGKDPSDERDHARLQRKVDLEALRERERQLNSRATVQGVFDEWVRRQASGRKDRGAEVKRSFGKDVLPRIGRHYAAEVTREQITRLLDRVVDRGARRSANLLMADLHQMFRYAKQRGVIANDPMEGMTKADVGGKDVERDRVLSEAEIKELSAKLSSARLSTAAEAALWIMLATGCRVGEISRARWVDIDFADQKWTIPPEHSKNGKAHVVQLSPFALDRFQRLRTEALAKVASKDGVDPSAAELPEWIYANRKSTDHLSVKSLQKQFADRQRTERFAGRSKCVGTLSLPGGRWTAHDLRRTAATLMGELGTRSDVIDRVLNHIEQRKVTRIYQQQELLSERRQALMALGERLELLAGTSRHNVVLMPMAAAA